MTTNKKFPGASLLIATYNWPEALELLLLSVLHQDRLPAEILIADDGSGPQTKELIQYYAQQFSIPVKHFWHEDKGFRKTIILNRAIASAGSEYIIEVDGDVILDPHFISDHLRLAESGTFVRGTRAHLRPAMTEQAIKKKQFRFHYYSKGVKHRNNAFRSVVFSALGITKQMSSHSVRGSNLAFWKEDFVKVNGYNNDLCGWGHEDEELAARFINNGIIKKKIKLACVQYHLYHPVASADEEPLHRSIINKVIENKVLYCMNGLKQLIK
jgi:glycosyltransferase involved in cell wall biosynthesis